MGALYLRSRQAATKGREGREKAHKDNRRAGAGGRQACPGARLLGALQASHPQPRCSGRRWSVVLEAGRQHTVLGLGQYRTSEPDLGLLGTVPHLAAFHCSAEHDHCYALLLLRHLPKVPDRALQGALRCDVSRKHHCRLRIPLPKPHVAQRGPSETTNQDIPTWLTRALSLCAPKCQVPSPDHENLHHHAAALASGHSDAGAAALTGGTCAETWLALM